jgi:hypothetical protein
MEKEAQEYADVIAAEVMELEAALEALLDEDAEAADFDGVTFTDAYDVIAYYLDACALSVEDVTVTSFASGTTTVTRRSVEVTRTVGGPGCVVIFDGNGRAEVRAYWGTGTGIAYAYAPYADGELWEALDALSEHAGGRP